MLETSLSLLERLRLQPDSASWERLLDLYQPLIRCWLQRLHLQISDVDDLTQEVLSIVVQKMPAFQHDLRRGAFRRWLRSITVNTTRAYWRRRRSSVVASGDSEVEQFLSQLEDPSSRLSQVWDEEHDRHVVRRLLQMIETDFEPTTWRAFRGQVLEERHCTDIADELGISPNAARIAKARVLRRLREEIEGLVS